MVKLYKLFHVILLIIFTGCKTVQVTPDPLTKEQIVVQEVALVEGKLSRLNNVDFPYVVHEVTCHNPTEYEIDKVVFFLYYVDENNKMLSDRDTYQCIFEMQMEDTSEPMKIITFINEKAVRAVVSIKKIFLTDGTVIDYANITQQEKGE